MLIPGVSSLNTVAVDTFLPAMPAIAEAMAVDPGTLGITLGIFMLGTGFGQIIFGLSLYVLAALIASYAANIEELSLIRFIQGIGASSGRILV